MNETRIHDNGNKKIKSRLLLVDDDEDFRSSVTVILQTAGYEVVQAEDGKAAQSIFEIEEFDAIISDIRMPRMDGVTFLHYVNRTKPVPFILMTGFSEILETYQAHDAGATDFIAKPFRKEELLTCLEVNLPHGKEHLSPSGSFEREDLDSSFCKLNIDEFVSATKVLADVHVRLAAFRYVKVARKGSLLSRERLDSYKGKGLLFLYIKKEDFAQYVGFNVELSKLVLSKTSRVPKPQKVALLKHTTEVILQDVYINGADKVKFESASTLVEAIISTLSEDEDLFFLLKNLETHADHLYAHSLGVSLYSCMIAKHIGWVSAPTSFKIGLGGLLHDIGKKEISKEILSKPRQLLSAKEREIYETHPIRGKEILSRISCIPDDVIQIALHHHENDLGRGFPQCVSKLKIHPLARLVAVANEFCDLALKGSDGRGGMEVGPALERLYALKGQEVDPMFLKALFELFNQPLPDALKKLTRIAF